jgi:hypothetical protein
MTPQAILDRLLALFPDFAAEWNSDHNYFRDDDGTFTRCGAFMQFSHFFRAWYGQFSTGQITELGAFVSACVASADADLRDVALSCFVENIWGESCWSDFRKYLSDEAVRYFTE